MFFLVFASISLRKNKKTQALVKFYALLIQKFGCVPTGDHSKRQSDDQCMHQATTNASWLLDVHGWIRVQPKQCFCVFCCVFVGWRVLVVILELLGICFIKVAVMASAAQILPELFCCSPPPLSAKPVCLLPFGSAGGSAGSSPLNSSVFLIVRLTNDISSPEFVEDVSKPRSHYFRISWTNSKFNENTKDHILFWIHLICFRLDTYDYFWKSADGSGIVTRTFIPRNFEGVKIR